MPRLVRRAPLQTRLKNYLWDTLLWLSEELDAEEWAEAQKEWALPLGVALNAIFLLARANSTSQSQESYDVFGDHGSRRGSGWLAWLSSSVVTFLVAASCLNALYTFARKRHYRLFEAPVDTAPSTPSARRVRVDSSPSSFSALRLLSSVLPATAAESRAHPDPSRDVWELAVWDPAPICLRLFCLFSPGHVLTYCMLLPAAPLDPRPSVTVATTIGFGALLSVQLHWLQTHFLQQAKDQAVIAKEVLHEYDTKHVHPSLHKPVRDVGIQTPGQGGGAAAAAASVREVDVYTPTTVVNRGFHTNPNPAYAQHYDRDAALTRDQQYQTQQPLRLGATPPLATPLNGYASSSAGGPDMSSPIRQRAGATAFTRQPSPQKGAGDGGSLGVFTHAASPLRKAASANYLKHGQEQQGHLEAGRSRREGSPLKRVSMPEGISGGGGGGGGDRRSTGVQGTRAPSGDVKRQSRYF